MPATVSDLLERERADLARREGRDFYLQLAPHLDFLAKHRRLRKLIARLEQETQQRLAGFVAAQNRFIEEAAHLRGQVARRAPEVDNSGLERPGPESQHRFRYDLDSFAHFDELVRVDSGIGYPALPRDGIDPGPVGTLLVILRGRLNAAQYGEDGNPTRDENRRPDLDDLVTAVHNLEERRQHALRAFRQESRTLPGLAHARLRLFASELNPAPVIIETDEDRERLVERVIRDFGSPRGLVQKLVNGGRLDEGELREVEEITQSLKEEADRLHRELARQLELAPWWQKALDIVRREPLIVTIVGGVLTAVLAAIILTFF